MGLVACNTEEGNVANCSRLGVCGVHMDPIRSLSVHAEKKIFIPKTGDGIFIRCVSDSNANKLLTINSEISGILNNTIVEARDAHYFENIFPCKIRLNTGVAEDNPGSSSIQAEPNSSQVRHLEEKT